MLKEYYDKILFNISKLVINASGLGVVKRLIMHMKTRRTFEIVHDFLLKNSLMLVQNAYGNYALQAAIEVSNKYNNNSKRWDNQFSENLFKNFFSFLHQLSMQKYSSNVLEKCFEYGGEVSTIS